MQLAFMYNILYYSIYFYVRVPNYNFLINVKLLADKNRVISALYLRLKKG